ncbi:hypothetical protein EIK77_002362 [Talaromyces pinophilus]|nr:hypothetical protein EIK77_002362 [Talaromyces pinophilus]
MIPLHQALPLLAIASLGQAVVTDPIFKSAHEAAIPFGISQDVPSILIDPKDWPGVIRAAQGLGSDFGHDHYPILVGTVGKSDLIDSLVASHELDISAVQDQWESYIQKLVESPFPGSPDVLVIAGSDKRGTIYGMYDVSEQIGVSPWFWWVDVPVSPQPALYWENNALKTQGPPSVKYRGIFLNDEAPCLSGWVTANYGTIAQYGELGFNSQFCAKLFELLLRLKANYLWPAMWSNMFYVDDANNGPTADLYGIVMGTSHTEPMARASNEEYHFLNGSWDWI